MFGLLAASVRFFDLSALGFQSSPIYDHLPTGSIIEYLDDTKLAGKEDIWTQFLGGEDNDETRGWCVDKKRYLGRHLGSASRPRPAHGLPSYSCLQSALPGFRTGSIRSRAPKHVRQGKSTMPPSLPASHDTYLGLSLYISATTLRQASA